MLYSDQNSLPNNTFQPSNSMGTVYQQTMEYIPTALSSVQNDWQINNNKKRMRSPNEKIPRQTKIIPQIWKI